jgi:hypothetical protein
MSYRNTVPLPSVRCNDYNHQNLLSDLTPIHAKNKNSDFRVCAYTHGFGTSLPANSYVGGCYSPTQNRIYLSPYAKATTTTWHYIDCNTGSVIAYTAPALIGSQHSMVYDPFNDRMYLIPNALASTWAYIDCRTSTVNTFAGIATASFAGGSYSPKQNKIYLAPFSGSELSTWYGIDCATGTVFSYTNNSGVAAEAVAYVGACYSPTQDRIYFTPAAQYLNASWHYVNCSNGSVVAYTHGQSPVGNITGGVYSPTQNRIYMPPYLQSISSTWYYINCNTGAVVPYTGASGLPASAYYGGAYSPATNRIYLCPRFSGASQSSIWHYIDCNTGAVVPYTHEVTTVANTYLGMVYSPTQSRIYMVPFAQAAQSEWHYIQEYVSAEIPPAVAAYPMFNKF